MERYSNSTREVAQDGRRGALMLSVSIQHPDSESFIDAKMTEGKVTGANVSVKLDDEFMQAAVENRMYTQRFPINSEHPTVQKEINAAALWKRLYTMHGNRLNRVFCFGIPSYVNQFPTVMQT